MFVAVDVGDAVRREAARVVSALALKLEAAKTPPKVVWVKPAALHVTIRFLGEVEADDVERLQPLLAPPIAVAPFEVAVARHRHVSQQPASARAVAWRDQRRGAAGASRSRDLAARRRRSAVELDDRALLPHLTLGRVKMAGAGVDWPKILQACEVRNATSRVDSVSLYQSELSQHGPHYTELVSAPLIGDESRLQITDPGPAACHSDRLRHRLAADRLSRRASARAASICAASAAAMSARPTSIARAGCAMAIAVMLADVGEGRRRRCCWPAAA